MTLDHLSKCLQGLLGEELVAVILFGPVAENPEAECPELNLLIVTERLDVPCLKELSPVLRDWVNAGNPEPMLFSKERILRSGDAFPVEFLDIKECHRVIYGENILRQLEIRGQHFHRELEHLLKNMLLYLRSRYMLTEKRGELLCVLIRSRAALHLYFRAALRIFVPRTASSDRTNIENLALHTSFNPLWIHDLAYLEQGKELEPARIEVIYEHVLRAIETVIDAVDREYNRRKGMDQAGG